MTLGTENPWPLVGKSDIGDVADYSRRFLYIHGFITEGESVKILRRIRKNDKAVQR